MADYDNRQPHRLPTAVLSELYGATRDGKSSSEGAVSNIKRKLSDKSRKYNMKPKIPPPSDLPVHGKAYKPDRQQSPVYDLPAQTQIPSTEETPMGIGRREGNNSIMDPNRGYLQPLELNPVPYLTAEETPSATNPLISGGTYPPDSYGRPYDEICLDERTGESIYDIAGPGSEGIYDPVHNETQNSSTGNNNNTGAIKTTKIKKTSGSSQKKKKLFQFGKKRQQSLHVYAEPDIAVGNLSAESQSQLSDDKYSNLVHGGSAIYASNDNLRADESSTNISTSRVGCLARLRHFMERRKPSSFPCQSRRCIVCMIVLVLLLVSLAVALAVYFLVFHGENISSAQQSCPPNQYSQAAVGQLEVQVHWDEEKSKFNGFEQSNKPGDTFPAGKTTPVTYKSRNTVVCYFNVTVEAEGRPQNQIVVNNVTSTTMAISWAIPDADSIQRNDSLYFVHIVNQYGKEVTLDPPAKRPAGSGIRALNYQLSGLLPGYGYSIVVSNSELELNISGFGRTEPYPPGKITVNGIGSKAISISWIAAVGFFHKYQISYMTRHSNRTITAGTVTRSRTEYTILELTESTTYTVYVQTISGNKKSEPEVVDNTTTSHTFLTVKDVGVNYITVDWSAQESGEENYAQFWLVLDVQADNEDGIQFTDYRTYQYPGGRNGVYRLPDDERQQQFPQLDSGKLYRIRIMDIPSAKDPVQLDAAYARTVPAQPTDVVVGAPSIVDKNAKVTITWSPPTASNAYYDGFVLTYEPGNGQPEPPIEIGRDSTEIVLEELDLATNYQLDVRTFAGRNVFRKESDPSPKSLSVRSVLNDFNIKEVTTTTITIVYNLNDDVERASVSIVSLDNDLPDQKVAPLSDLSEGSYTFTQLLPGQTYNISLSASSLNMLDNKYYTSVLATTVPITVSNLIVTHSTPTSLSIQWDSEGLQYTEFEVAYSLSENNVQLRTTNPRINITDLSSDTEYTVSVVTVSRERKSKAAVISEYTAPTPTGQLSVISYDTTSIVVTWGRSYDPLATGYVLQASAQAHQTDEQQKSLDELQATFDNLLPGTRYTITLRVTGVQDGETDTEQSTKSN